MKKYIVILVLFLAEVAESVMINTDGKSFKKENVKLELYKPGDTFPAYRKEGEPWPDDVINGIWTHPNWEMKTQMLNDKKKKY